MCDDAVDTSVSCNFWYTDMGWWRIKSFDTQIIAEIVIGTFRGRSVGESPATVVNTSNIMSVPWCLAMFATYCPNLRS